LKFMKIVFMNPVGAIGGAERVLLTMLAALLKEQPDIQLHLIVGTDGPLIEQAKNLGVEVTLLKLPEEFNQVGDSALKKAEGRRQKAEGKIQLGTQSQLIWDIQHKCLGGDLNPWLPSVQERVRAFWRRNLFLLPSALCPLPFLLMLLLRLVKTLPSIGRYLREIHTLLRELKPDLIHSNGIKTHVLIALAGVKGVPVVWHIHDFYSSRPLMAWILKWSSDRTTLGIAVSQAVAQDARVTLPRLPIDVIYNTVDVNHFSPTPPSSHLPLRVGLVATFARWKGHDVFLEAAAKLVRSRLDLNVRFCIVGEPIYKTRGSQFSEQELRHKAEQLEITSKVDFLGFQQNIVEIYHWLDVVVHASTQPEPFGLVIVEAMACGKPVIVSQAGGAAELFTHNYDAVAVRPGEPDALAAAIEYLLDNPNQRQSLSANARLTVTQRFNDQNLGQHILAVYRKFNT
jgi:glycosyltransferase involved in cell wall biosynthesis